MLTAAQSENLCVVLVASRNPLNIGAAARAMSNFGFSQLRVVNPYEIAFREARSAVGAAELLANAQEYKTLADAVADCTLVFGTTAGRDRELKQPLKTLHEITPEIQNEFTRAQVALVFGSEKRGLSNDDLSYCNCVLHIPTRDTHLSMNLSQAVAICLYELARDTGTQPPVDIAQLASSGELTRIETVLLNALNESGYTNPESAAATQEKVRRMLRRLKPTSDDAEVLLGMLRQIVWKLKKS